MATDDLTVSAQKFEPFPAAEEPPPKGKGCLFWGCLISSILLVLLIIAIVVGVFALRRASINFIKQYTQEQPMKLPELQIGEQEATDAKKRWDDFRAALDEGKPARLELTSDELNSILYSDSEEMKGKVFFRIEDDKLTGDVSIPAGAAGEFLKTQELEGRYLNASGTFDISLSNGRLGVFITDATVSGQKIPAEAAQSLRQQNLAEQWAREPDNAAMLDKLETLELKDGKLILESRGASGDEATEAPAKAEDEAAPEAAGGEAKAEGEAEALPEDEAKPEPEAAPSEAPATPETPETPKTPETPEPPATPEAPEGTSPEAPSAPETPAPQAA